MDPFSGKTLLITGGTGSFGNAVLRRFIGSDIDKIRILSRDEKKQDEMRRRYQNDKIEFYIGDVRDYSSIIGAFEGVDFLFHAAALKQVPSCEFFPMEAVKTNVVGSNNVIDACIAKKVKKAVFLSTDKAAYPINTMGMTKALMEKNIIARSRNLNDTSDPVFCVTRYGNVMASRGSVIPFFADLIEKDEPVTITNPEMTRFLMTLDEAVDLVLYAFEHGTQGDLFVQKAPSCTIGDLAEAIMKYMGKRVETKIIGTRHGEKLYETLVTKEEMVRAVDTESYYRILADNRNLNYEVFFSEGNDAVETSMEYNSENTTRLDVDLVVDKLGELGSLQESV